MQDPDINQVTLGAGGPVSWHSSRKLSSRAGSSALDVRTDSLSSSRVSSSTNDEAAPRRFQSSNQSFKTRQDPPPADNLLTRFSPIAEQTPLDSSLPRRFRPTEAAQGLPSSVPPDFPAPPSNMPFFPPPVFPTQHPTHQQHASQDPQYNPAQYRPLSPVAPQPTHANSHRPGTSNVTAAGQRGVPVDHTSQPLLAPDNPRTTETYALVDKGSRTFLNPVQESLAPLFTPGSIRSDYPAAKPRPTGKPVAAYGAGLHGSWRRNYPKKSETSCFCRIFCTALTILFIVGLSLAVYFGVKVWRGRTPPKGIDPNRQVEKNPLDGGPDRCDSKGILQQITSSGATRDVRLPSAPAVSTSTLHIKFKPEVDPILKQVLEAANATVGPNLHLDHLTPGQIASFLNEKFHGGWIDPQYNSWLTDLAQRIGPDELDVVKYIKNFYYGAYANVLIVEFDGITPLQFQGLISLLQGQTGQIEWVTADKKFSKFETFTRVNDPHVGDQWGIQSIGVLPQAHLQVPPAWTVTTGSRSIVVAVLDTGIDLTHRDLAPNLWYNPGEQNGTAGSDDDNNGKIDDIHGWNFLDNNTDLFDPEGHGTHVAGILGAVANNGLYGAGVSPVVSIMVLKVLDSTGGGWTSGLYRALEYALEKEAHIVSLSLGTYGEDPSLEAVLEKARDAGQLVIAAAGNNRNDNDKTPTYPASYNMDNLISVGWMDRYECIAPLGNYGKKTVHLMAPGSLILSTYPSNIPPDSDFPGMGVNSGSSQATPHVAGAAALILAYWEQQGKNYKGQAKMVKKILLDSVDKIPMFENFTVSGGKLNVARALVLAANATLPASRSAAWMTVPQGNPLIWLTAIASLWMSQILVTL